MKTLPVTNALISVSDKTGLDTFARALSDDFGVTLYSTGGTFRYLKENNIPVKKVEDLTGVPEILGGRVKTLHPAIFGGILARRNFKDDMHTLEKMEYPPFDLVVVNLYPFGETVKKPDVTEAECIENIDIGGVALLRAAAKNYAGVTVVNSPEEYDTITSELRENEGISGETRKRLALKTFAATAEYDAAIFRHLSSEDKFPHTLTLSLERKEILRYGENPHQEAALYREPSGSELFAGKDETCISRARQLHGKQISYNNLCDTDAAFEIVRECAEPAVSIIKHANPCGFALGENIAEAYSKALECDPMSAFGGIVAMNRPCNGAVSEKISTVFTEVVIAPSFTEDALETLTKKKNIRLLETGPLTPQQPTLIARSITGGMLFQDRDLGKVTKDDLDVVTEAQPTPEDIEGLLFAWKVVKWVKSNAIVFTHKDRSAAIGAGQMSRIDAAHLAAKKARSSLEGTYMGSDAFFPFRDSVDFAAEKGVRAIIQPGGSKRDQESIDACNEHGIIMVFTGMRHFRH